jgi:ATP phosphoribosyltransferase regulatory subunit
MESSDDRARVLSSVQALYNRYGYRPYRMSKFEEYDLYAKNKDFLISDSVITFTDRSGKLMALKPDVTLSIVKNTADTNAVQKLSYQENVYRVSKGSDSFRELLQVGLECLGNIDDYCICEVLLLAVQSLQLICPSCVLDISHLGLVTQVLDALDIPRENHPAVFALMGDKNLHELQGLCRSMGIREEAITQLLNLLKISGSIPQTLPKLQAWMAQMPPLPAFSRFEQLLTALGSTQQRELFHIDFSVVDDVHYYNGVVFKGFVSGVPSSVLSGGQYDRLMKKMGRSSGALGFAIYTDELERLWDAPNPYDVETVLLYPKDAPFTAVAEKVAELTRQGRQVLALSSLPEDLRYQQLLLL